MRRELPPVLKERVPELEFCCGSLCDRNKLIDEVRLYFVKGPQLMSPAQVGDKVFEKGTPWIEVVAEAITLHENNNK